MENVLQPLHALAQAERRPPDLLLTPELRAVLNLPGDLRRCFVLRILAGFSGQACGLLLRLSVRKVDEYTCLALHRLADFTWEVRSTRCSIRS
jgi:hypothetical protein